MTLPVDPVLLLAFVPAALALNFTPGADMMFCLGQGLRGGPRAALAANAGIALGVMVHALLAGLGLGALVVSFPPLFDLIRWAGVAYLLWLAVALLRSDLPGTGTNAALTPARAFRQALVVNLSNPKILLFVLAFFPQFVDVERGAMLAQFLLLGAVLSAGGLIANGFVGGFASGLGRSVAGSAWLRKVLALFSAGVFAALALRLALLQRS